MRSLSRPMFNMGGPIKQGIMHGIREPYRGGGQAALVGNPVYPKTGGREHHGFFLAAAPWLARMLGTQAVKKVAQKGIGSVAQGEMAKKGIQESIKRAAGAGAGAGTGTAAAAPVYTGMKGYFMRDPLVKSALWAKDALFNPTTAGWGKSLARGLTSPSSLGLIGYGGYQYLKGDKADPTVTGVEKPGGYPGGTIVEEKVKVLSDAERKAFANKQREERVQKYLDLMGYDRSKKMAIADALIDASKIVGDRGTLDKRNITQELINPIIQATSKRLDKPDQIREAVGLMATKAEIEKDLNKETKDLDRRYKKAQIKAAEAGLEQTESFEGGMKAFLSARKGAVAANELAQMARLLANEHNETFKKVTGDEEVTVDGIYMKDGNLFRVTAGVSEQIV